MTNRSVLGKFLIFVPRSLSKISFQVEKETIWSK